MRRSSAAWPVGGGGWSGLARMGSSSSSPTTTSTVSPSEPNSGASPPDQLVQSGGVAGSDYSTERSASSNGRVGKGSQLPHQVDSAHPLLEHTPLSVGLPAYSSTTSATPPTMPRGSVTVLVFLVDHKRGLAQQSRSCFHDHAPRRESKI